MKIKVAKASGPVLDWMVAKAMKAVPHPVLPWKPSTDWSQGGPIIDREFIHLLGWRTKSCDKRVAFLDTEAGSFKGLGPTGLIAAMRCYVASKLGEEVDVPEELI